jgi:hypothetical protein
MIALVLLVFALAALSATGVTAAEMSAQFSSCYCDGQPTLVLPAFTATFIPFPTRTPTPSHFIYFPLLNKGR